MEKGVTSSFCFNGHKIIKSYFEKKSGQEGKELSISFLPKGIINKSNSTFDLELLVRIEDESNVFVAEITTIGYFSFKDCEFDEKTLDGLFYVNAPAILFPYIRAYLATLTTLSGLRPVIMPSMNLTNLAADLKTNTTLV